jgi:hypothetical protein
VAEVHAVFDRFCDRTLNPDARRHGLAFELARLDRLLEACWPKAVGGDLAAIALAEKLSATLRDVGLARADGGDLEDHRRERAAGDEHATA